MVCTIACKHCTHLNLTELVNVPGYMMVKIWRSTGFTELSLPVQLTHARRRHVHSQLDCYEYALQLVASIPCITSADPFLGASAYHAKTTSLFAPVVMNGHLLHHQLPCLAIALANCVSRV